MSGLKSSSSFCLAILVSVIGCTTSTYRVLNSGEFGTEIRVSPDRVLLECERLYDADEPGLSGFMIRVLDEENTLLTLVQGNTLDNKTCDHRIKKVNQILAEGKSIYIAGTGDLSRLRQTGKTYAIPRKGTFASNGRVLGFAAIANEFGSCFDAYSGDEKPCPRDPFPLKSRK
ncbi:MAG: hypothetical protein ACK5Y2_00040 [Bdellovibrionales bacterium]